MAESPSASLRGRGAEFEELTMVLSDMHLADGKQNPLEDFPHDGLFMSFVTAALKKYARAKTLRLRLLGDIFDPLAVRFRGRLTDPPYEDVGVMKMRKIVRGHRTFFDALRRFVSRDNCRLDVFVGNHDQFLVWPGVKRVFIDAVCHGDGKLAARIKFFCREEEFRELAHGVLYYHGMNMEPHNSIDPDDAILSSRFGKTFKRPLLNQPPATHLVVGVAYESKLRNPNVGRVNRVIEVWKNAAIHRWLWIPYVVLALAATFIRYQFVAIIDPRRKVGAWRLFKIALGTMQHHQDVHYARKWLRETGAKWIIMGHTHEPCIMVFEDGTVYINTGSWSLQHAFKEPEFELRWKRFQGLERMWRAIGHLRRDGRLGRFLFWSGAVVALLLVQFYTFTASLLMVLALVLVSGLLRLFSVRPEVRTFVDPTFAQVERLADGTVRARLMEYVPDTGMIRERP